MSSKLDNNCITSNLKLNFLWNYHVRNDEKLFNYIFASMDFMEDLLKRYHTELSHKIIP